jgi:hypothetical protein
MAAEQEAGKTTRCPACGTEIERHLARCSACGILISRKRRRGVAAASDAPFSPVATPHNLAALRAYRVSLISVLPGVGLVAGPISCVQGILARHRGRFDPQFTAHGPAIAAIALGGLAAVANWVGFALMYAGLRQAGWF